MNKLILTIILIFITIIGAAQPPCNKSVDQFISSFNPDPLYGYMQFSYDTLTITSTASCDINIRPDFIISHEDSVIEVGDFTIEWYNPIIQNWPNIPYTIDASGNAVGFWSSAPTDSTGINLTTGAAEQMLIRVRFMNPNNNPNPTPTNYGTYTASWTTFEVDSLGNKIQALSQADSVSLSLVNCNLFEVNNSSYSDISCYELNDGTATINSISNGSGSYSYIWNTGDTTQTISNLQAGSYSCTITDNNWSSCSTATSFTITEPDSLSCNFTTTNVSCYGANDGSAIVNFFGGTIGSANGDTNYILSWDTLIHILPFPYTIFTTPVGVPAGVYPFSATDLNGCSIYDTITITQPDSLYTAYTLTDYGGYNISCNGYNNATVDVQINGGTSPFTHYFDGNIITNNPIQNLGSGIFTDSIIDANNCIHSNNITITEPTAINATLTSDDISCFNYCDGEVQISVSGGIAPYSYNWSTTSGLDSLCTGSYTVMVTDYNNCDTNLSIFVSEPDVISYSIDSMVNVSSYGGSNGMIQISAFGGVGNLNISWTGPNGFTSTGEDIDSLIAGAYYFTITDSNACVFTDTALVLSQPSSLSASISVNSDVSCNGVCDGSIDITADGGDSVYFYLWTGPNGYTSTNEDLNGLCAGTYYLALSDTSDTIYDTITINEPLALFSFLTADTITCYNGFSFADVLVYGGTSPFGYNWSNGATNYFTNLYAGFHTVEVTDANGCILLDTIILSNPDSISLQASISDVSCYGLQDAVVEINVISGGTAPYLYSANNGINNQPTSIFFNIGAGNYTYLITDTNGCSNEIYITVNQPDSFYSSFALTNTSCYGVCDGNAITTIYGGTPPYIEDWGSAIPSALCAGYYNVTITDFNGCLITDGVTISEPNPIIVNIWQNGTGIEATSGFNSYQWYDHAGNPIVGATTNIFVPIIQGEYYVQVTDSNGCSINSYSILFLIDAINEHNLLVNIYPNPTNDKLIIDCSEDFNTILVFNILGKEVYKIDNKHKKQTLKIIDLSSFKKGIYFVQIEVNNQLITQRIILQ